MGSVSAFTATTAVPPAPLPVASTSNRTSCQDAVTLLQTSWLSPRRSSPSSTAASLSVSHSPRMDLSNSSSTKRRSLEKNRRLSKVTEPTARRNIWPSIPGTEGPKDSKSCSIRCSRSRGEPSAAKASTCGTREKTLGAFVTRPRSRVPSGRKVRATVCGDVPSEGCSSNTCSSRSTPSGVNDRSRTRCSLA